MKSLLTYVAVFLLAVVVVYAIDSKEKHKTRWVQVPCPLSEAIIYDWGKCTTIGKKFDCTNAHWGFTAECVDEVNSDTREQTIVLTHPRAVLVEQQDLDTKTK